MIWDIFTRRREDNLIYRRGQKVGVFDFDTNSNEDVINEGVILAHRLDYMSERPRYAVKLKNGEVKTFSHEDIWELK